MTKLFAFCSFLFFYSICSAQNLVPNPSFEEYENGCPEDWHDMPLHWGKWRESPNSFSTCVSPQTVTDSLGWAPTNAFGYQVPFDGESYIGLSIYNNLFSGELTYREIVGAELLAPLQANSTYHVSFQVSLTLDGFYYEFPYACNLMGVYFTNQSYDEEINPMPIFNEAHIYSEEIIVDSLNWTTIEGEFTADQNYTHIAFGGFFENEYFDTIQLFGDDGYVAYYYLDGMVVEEIKDSSHVISGNIDIPNITIFPNPTNSKLTISGIEGNVEYQLINSAGICVKESILRPNETISLAEISAGVYFIKLKLKNSSMVRKVLVYD